MNVMDFYTFHLYNPLLKDLTQNNRYISCKHIKDAFKADWFSSLSLINCNIQNAPNSRNLPSLSSIDMSFNSIQCLHAEAFQFLGRLQYVSFNSNALTFVILESLSRVLWNTSDVLIDLLSNPLHCVYSLEWFKIYYENNINWTSGNACLFTCNTPTQWRGLGVPCRLLLNQLL